MSSCKNLMKDVDTLLAAIEKLREGKELFAKVEQYDYKTQDSIESAISRIKEYINDKLLYAYKKGCLAPKEG